jgi:hypothetical protein
LSSIRLPSAPPRSSQAPEPVRENLHAALATAADDDPVDPAGRHRAPVVDAEPQLRPANLGVPGADADVAVQGAGGVVADLDRAGVAAPAANGDLSMPQVDIAVLGLQRIPAISASRTPVARNIAMTTASRRSLNELPRQAPRSCESPMLVKQGTGLRVSFGGCSRATGSGMPSSTASHRKNCCSPRSWPRAQASLYRASSRTVHTETCQSPGAGARRRTTAPPRCRS